MNQLATCRPNVSGARKKYVVGVDGNPFTPSDIPSPDTPFWSDHHKAAIIVAIRVGFLSLGEVRRRFRMTFTEYFSWREAVDGVKGRSIPCSLNTASSGTITCGSLVVDLEAQGVRVDSRLIHLPLKEYRLLECLALYKGWVVTHCMLSIHMYGDASRTGDKVIEVHLCKLRKKLGEAADGRNYIETTRGRGYLLVDPAVQAEKAA